MKFTMLFLMLISASCFAQIPSIGVAEAFDYEVASFEVVKDSNSDYIFSCIVSKANTKKERAQTMVRATLDIVENHKNKKIAIYLAPHVKLCQEGRLMGTSYFNPAADGWKAVAGGAWTWNILTTDSKVTEQQISDTVLYEDNKPEFKSKFGALDYSEKLDKYVAETVGRKPNYVTSGLWVDTFLVE